MQLFWNFHTSLELWTSVYNNEGKIQNISKNMC